MAMAPSIATERDARGAVLSVIASTDRRGAECFGVQLCSSLRDRGRPADLVALSDGRSPGLDVPTLGPTRTGPATLRALRQAARDADVVICHGSTTGPATYLATMGLRTPYIYRNIGDPHAWITSPSRRLRTTLMLRKARAVVALTPRSARSISKLCAVDPSRIHVIPNGRSPQHFRPATPQQRAATRAELGVADDALVVAYAGALEPVKQVDLAIAAVARVHGAHLVVAGDGTLREDLQAQARLDMPGRATFLGTVIDTAPVLGAADVVVLSSRTEGLPGVLIEAGLCGVPAVGTDVGYVDEIVVDGVTGLVVPPDDPDALASAIRAAAADSASLGNAARTFCEDRFSSLRIVEQWDDLVGQLLGDPVT